MNAVQELLLSCVHQVVLYLPLESELISAAAQSLIALASCRNPARFHLLVGSHHVNQMALLITTPPVSGASHSGIGSAGCRLNGTGLMVMFEALGQLCVRATEVAFFSQVRKLLVLSKILFVAGGRRFFCRIANVEYLDCIGL